MKKLIILGAGIISIFGAATAQETFPNLYIKQISANGKYVATSNSGVNIINTEDNTNVGHPDILLGLGNAISNNGIAVGDYLDQPIILMGEEEIFPQNLSGYWLCGINAITPDGTRLVGFSNNQIDTGEVMGGIMYIPFYASVDENGHVGAPVKLPYPEYDFFGFFPQYVTTVWISDDGKTILGQVANYFGFSYDPIVFTQDDKGEWSYERPSRPLFNPDNIEIPDSPFKDAPPMPEYEDFMSPESYQVYREVLEAWYMGEYPDDDMPTPFDFMTNEEEMAYWEAVEIYIAWLENTENQINQYFAIRDRIEATSVNFGLNDLAMNAAGTQFACSGSLGNGESDIYLFTLENGEWKYEKLESSIKGINPMQILPDGTISAAEPQIQYSPLKGYIRLPGADDFITPAEYLASINNETYSRWLSETLPYGSGQVYFNEEMTIMGGGAIFANLANFEDIEDFYYFSYILKNINNSNDAVESIKVETADGKYHVYNLQGMKVAETEDAASIRNLPKGIYIINGSKVVI